MTSWRRINLLLAAYVALLAAVWFWPAGDDAPLPPLTDIDVAAVSTIRVERGNRLVMAFERQGSTWNMSYPHTSPAVAQRVTRLLAIAQAPVWQHLPADATAQRFGLAAPTTTVQFDTTRIGFCLALVLSVSNNVAIWPVPLVQQVLKPVKLSVEICDRLWSNLRRSISRTRNGCCQTPHFVQLNAINAN